MKAKTVTLHSLKSNSFKSSTVQKTFLSLVVLSCLVFTLSISAVEIKPADSGNPVELSPDFDSLGSGNQLLQDNSNNTKAKNKQKSLWDWLTSTSRKPANYHYIDFMELLY